MLRFSALGLDAVELSYKDLCGIGCERMRELLLQSSLEVSAVFVFLDLDCCVDAFRYVAIEIFDIPDMESRIIRSLKRTKEKIK